MLLCPSADPNAHQVNTDAYLEALRIRIEQGELRLQLIKQRSRVKLVLVEKQC
jgi:hypothetical protein